MWIEIKKLIEYQNAFRSHPARGVWIEIAVRRRSSFYRCKSHPARGVWIEMPIHTILMMLKKSHPARGVWIEITKMPSKTEKEVVAPRKGCVD